MGLWYSTDMAAPRSGDLQRLIWRANVLLPGLYAWAATVAQPAMARGSPVMGRVTALLALACLILGTVLAVEHPRPGRVLGILGFAVLSVGTWALLGHRVGVEQLEPVRACLGAVGWMLFAFGWGAVRTVGSVPEDDPNVVSGPPLRARGGLPSFANWVLGLAVTCALLPVLLAWRVTRPDHALFAHAGAALAAMATVTVGGIIAVERGQRRPAEPLAAGLRAASHSLSLLALVIVVGVFFTLLG